MTTDQRVLVTEQQTQSPGFQRFSRLPIDSWWQVATGNHRWQRCKYSCLCYLTSVTSEFEFIINSKFLVVIGLLLFFK